MATERPHRVLTDSRAVKTPGCPRRRRVSKGDGRGTNRKIADDTLVKMLAQGHALADIARAHDMSPQALHRRIIKLGPYALASLLAQRNREQRALIRQQVQPVDVAQELFAIRAQIAGTLTSVQNAPRRDLRPRDRYRLEFLGYQRMLQWVDSLIAGNRDLLKLAGVTTWQSELMAVLKETSPELQRRFVGKLVAYGYIPMVPLSTSGFFRAGGEDGRPPQDSDAATGSVNSAVGEAPHETHGGSTGKSHDDRPAA